MAHFLRDERISDVWIDEDTLLQLDRAFVGAVPSMPESREPAAANQPAYFLTYIIRFDSKGYRVFSIHDLINYFRQADYVERVIFCLDSAESVRTNRAVGSYAELRLDQRDANTCFVSVSSDDGNWVDSSFCAVRDMLAKRRTRNHWARGAWAQLSLQILGILATFAFSVWAAAVIAPFLAIENSFLISFLLALLVLSNLWGYLAQRLMLFMSWAFPNLEFRRPARGRLSWLAQAVVGGIVVAIALYLINQTFAYVGQTLGKALGVDT